MKISHTIALLSILFLSACSTLENPVSDSDPLEPLNRKIFSFNQKADEHVLKPLAKGYDKITPDPVKTGVTNFFSNLSDIPNAANNLLQGKVKDSATSLARFGINSTIGILGLFDVASKEGIEQKKEDLGQTLAVWGIPSGPYVVLPFLGPSNLRDGSAKMVTAAKLNEKTLFFDREPRSYLTALELINTRYRLLGADSLLSTAALDPYNYAKNSYIQYRTQKITGKAITESQQTLKQEDELFEEETEFSDADLFKE